MYAMIAMRTIVMEIKHIDVHFHEHLAANPFLKCNLGCEKWPELGLLKLLRTGKTGTAAPKGRVPLSDFFKFSPFEGLLHEELDL